MGGTAAAAAEVEGGDECSSDGRGARTLRGRRRRPAGMRARDGLRCMGVRGMQSVWAGGVPVYIVCYIFTLSHYIILIYSYININMMSVYILVQYIQYIQYIIQ